MNIPDKIYLYEHLTRRSGSRLCEYWQDCKYNSENVRSIEFVRKDAILGRLLGFMREKKDKEAATIVGEIIEIIKTL